MSKAAQVNPKAGKCTVSPDEQEAHADTQGGRLIYAEPKLPSPPRNWRVNFVILTLGTEHAPFTAQSCKTAVVAWKEGDSPKQL